MLTFGFAALLLFSLAFSTAVAVWGRKRFLGVYRSFAVLRNEIVALREQVVRLRVDVNRSAKSVALLRKSKSFPPLLRSQFGEDLILLALFGEEFCGFFVEAGGYDGVTFSSTAVLESLGWSGLLVEPHPELYKACVVNRPKSVVKQAALGAPGETGTVEFTCVDYMSGSASPLSFRSAFAEQEHVDRCRKEGASFSVTRVPVCTLDQALAGLAQRVDLLVLDIEGHELQVLQGFDIDRFRPAVVLVEVHWTSEDEIVRKWFSDRQYVSCGLIGCNEFFAPAASSEKLRSLIAVFPDC